MTDALSHGLSASKAPALTGLEADPDTIASLPPTWPSERDVAAHPIDGQRFAALVCRLQELAAERAEASATVVRLRRMCEALEPFRPRDAGGGGGVQENLVTRNGEMEGELERMRTLLARVCGRVAALKAGEPGAQAAGEGLPMDVDVMRVADQKKADKLLQMLGHAGVQYNDTAPPP